MARTACALALLTLLAAPALAAAQQTPPLGMRAMMRSAAMDYASRAQVEDRDGRWFSAQALYHHALEADAGYLPAWLGLARSLDARGHRSEALELLRRVPATALVDDDSLAQLARALTGLGAAAEALALLATLPETALLLRVRVEVATGAGRFPEALRWARRLLDGAHGEPEREREVALLVRALTYVVVEADPVSSPGREPNVLRRLLARGATR